MRNEPLQPVVKWVGGKRQLLAAIHERFPDSYTTYYEPFIGGGAVLLDLAPQKAVINDYNAELINMYHVIQTDVEALLEELAYHEAHNTEAYFYDVRARDREPDYLTATSDVSRAARLLFLNKTCFNGLYRVNASGYFNSPYGRYKNPNIKNEDKIRALHNYFNTADITFRTGDFEDAVKYIRKGAFVYFDPPYAALTPTANYTGYTAGGFTEADQIRLKKLCDKLDKRGVKFMVSNANVPFIQSLYKDYHIDVVGAKRAINANGKKRGEVEEVLIRNYE